MARTSSFKSDAPFLFHEQCSQSTQKGRMNELKDIISDVQNGGDFCAGGRVPLPNPGMSIQGVGLVAFPFTGSINQECC